MLVVEVYSTLLLMNATIFVLGAEISQYDLRLNRIEYIPEPLKVHMIATLALPEYWYFPILSFNEWMRRAIAGLHSPPGYVLSDGFGVPGLTAPSLPVIGGDGTAACIAAASVIAKVTRDRIMVDLDRDLPGYDFALHKGYSTAHHMSCIDRLGPSREHRMSYRNVAARAGGRPPITADPDRDTLTG